MPKNPLGMTNILLSKTAARTESGSGQTNETLVWVTTVSWNRKFSLVVEMFPATKECSWRVLMGSTGQSIDRGSCFMDEKAPARLARWFKFFSIEIDS